MNTITTSQTAQTQTLAEFLKAKKEAQEAKKAERAKVRAEAKRLAEIEAKKGQKQVESITFNIEWKKSRTWGANPHLDAVVLHTDGSRSYGTAKCSGCGYDKESTVIADIFNQFMAYKLYQMDESSEKPYGIGIDKDYRHYAGGVGTSCYYRIAEHIGGKFEHVSSGKTFDVYKLTMG